jgi:FKBP-type peptidyl-prolyl cis-trans isomerase
MRIINFKKQMLLLGFVSLITLNSCLEDDNYSEQVKKDNKLIEQYLENNNLEATKSPYGFYYTVIESNATGKQVEEKDIVSVFYEIKTLNGTIIDEVKESSEVPKKINVLGNAIFPEGFLLGTALMKEGEKYRFYIPSNLAYGPYNYESLIPSNSVLIIESKIVKIESEDDQKQFEKAAIETFIAENDITDITETDLGVFYKKTESGTGNLPIKGDWVKIKYVAKYMDGSELGKTETDKTYDFTVGSESIIKGVSESVKLMQQGEKATFIIPSHLAYYSSLQIFPEKIREDLLEKGLISQKIPPFTNLIFEIELVEIN